MIVDDDRTTVKLLQTLLDLDGFEVSIAGKGADVIPMATQVMPQVILMDYHLSDMDGVDVLREMRANATFANMPIVMTSGLNVEDEVMEAGATAFLVKPFEPDELPKLFNSLLG
jgi:DNA-binding response OmpR family regulator